MVTKIQPIETTVEYVLADTCLMLYTDRYHLLDYLAKELADCEIERVSSGTCIFRAYGYTGLDILEACKQALKLNYPSGPKSYERYELTSEGFKPSSSISVNDLNLLVLSLLMI